MRLRETLQGWASAFEQVGQGHPYRGEPFILRNANIECTGRALPRGYKRGTPKECFSNATHLAIERGLQYCEGYAMHEEIGFPFLHAWCLSANGEVIDNTLEDPARYEYLGIKVPKHLLHRELQRNKVYGLINTGTYNEKFMKRYEKEVRT